MLAVTFPSWHKELQINQQADQYQIAGQNRAVNMTLEQLVIEGLLLTCCLWICCSQQERKTQEWC